MKAGFKIGLSKEDKQNMANDVYNRADAKITPQLNAMHETIQSLGGLKPSGVDSASNILSFTSNKGVYVANDTGSWYYWNGSSYVYGGMYQNDINAIDLGEIVPESTIEETMKKIHLKIEEYTEIQNSYDSQKVYMILLADTDGSYGTCFIIRDIWSGDCYITYFQQENIKKYRTGYTSDDDTLACEEIFLSNIANGSVTPEKTTFFEKSKNLLDFTRFKKGYSIDGSNGTSISVNNMWGYFDYYIEVGNNTKVTTTIYNHTYSKRNVLFCYDVNDNYLGKVDTGDGYKTESVTQTLLTNTAKFRLQLKINGDGIDITTYNMQCELGDTSTEYEEYYNAIPSKYLKIDVIDNLNSNENNKPLSANQGRILNDRLTGKYLEYDKTPINYGYNKFQNMEFESGSINTGNGVNVNPDLICIRTKDKYTFTSNIKGIIKNTLYRVKILRYLASDNSYVDNYGWYTSNFEFNISSDYLYRIQIATTNGSNIDINDTLNNVFFVLTEDLINKENELPSYWKNYLDERVNYISDYLVNGSDKSLFIFLTDTHYYGRDLHNINPLIPKYLADKLNIDTVIHGGDINSEYKSDIKVARQFMLEPIKLLKQAVPNVYAVRGNHDDNIEGGAEWKYVITQSDSYSFMFRGMDVNYGKTGTYYYKDNEYEKTRIICLDNSDFVYDNSINPTMPDEKILAFGFEQLDWLCNTLKSTPNNYHIIIVNHSMFAPSNVTIDNPNNAVQTRAKNYLIVCEILKAYKNRINFTFNCNNYFSSVHQEYFNGQLNHDFSNCNATIVGVFSGHEHVDCIEEILDSNGNGIGIYNTCTQNSSTIFGDDIISKPYQAEMILGTTTEYVYDVVIIDRKNRKVDMIRIGAGLKTNRSFNY